MKKKIFLLLTMLMAAILAGCSNPALEGKAAPDEGSGTVRFSLQRPGQAGGRSSAATSSAVTANSLQDAAKLLITINDSFDKSYYSSKELKIYYFNGSFISEELIIRSGNYKLVDYTVLNREGKVIFATPKEGSRLAHLAQDPLPINFTVSSDDVTNIWADIVDITGIKPEDLGYTPFTYNNPEIISFIVDIDTDRYTYYDPVLNVKAGAKEYNFNLKKGENRLYLNSLDSSYNFTFTLQRFVDYKASYSAAQLKAFPQNRLAITLVEDRPGNGIISLNNPKLETEVRKTLNKPNGYLFKSDLLNLASLDLSYSGISSLSGIEKLTSLTNLNLKGNSISDLTPLSGMTNLTLLNLYYNKIVDLSPLSTLTNLTALDLGYNKIVDLSPLSTLTNLTELTLNSNKIVDHSPLAILTNLKELRLSYTGLVDLSPFSALTNLTRLDLADNKIVDLTPLLNNSGIGAGDTIFLAWNSSLSTEAKDVQIPALRARGVMVLD